MLLLLNTLDFILTAYLFVLIGAAVFSWLYAFNIVNPKSELVRTLGHFFYALTEPVLRPIRRILPNFGSIDISPMIVFFIIYFIQSFIGRFAYRYFT